MSPDQRPDTPDTCPRCGGSFGCGMADASRPCACTRVALGAATLAELRQRYTGCLCLPCLVELARARPAAGPAAGP